MRGSLCERTGFLIDVCDRLPSLRWRKRFVVASQDVAYAFADATPDLRSRRRDTPRPVGRRVTSS
jgi:hypothetical protein